MQAFSSACFPSASGGKGQMRSQMRYLAAVFATVAVSVFDPAPAAAQDELAAVIQIESGGQPAMTMDYFLGPDRMRMDLDQGMSVVWFSGDSPRMLMVQHADRRYIEWGPDQLKMMQQMLQRMPGAGGGNEQVDFGVAALAFEETGQTATVGDWDAFEVRMTGADQATTFWMTTDIEFGLFEISQRVAEAADALRMPTAGGGAAGAQQFLRYQGLARAQGLPNGRVVRMNIDADGQPTTITLQSMEPGGLPADTFDPPSDYEQMQMPSIPGLPED